MVKFSASEARELSRSPVNTFPGCPPPIKDCCCVPPSPPAEGAALWAAPVVDGIPRPPPGMRTSPSASKPCRPNPNVFLYRVSPFELVRWMGSSVFKCVCTMLLLLLSCPDGWCGSRDQRNKVIKTKVSYIEGFVTHDPTTNINIKHKSGHREVD